MDSILHTAASIHTRILWSIDFECEFHQSVSDWEDIIFKRLEKMKRKDRVSLIRQCRAVGLSRLANDIEGSLGEITASERKLIY